MIFDTRPATADLPVGPANRLSRFIPCICANYSIAGFIYRPPDQGSTSIGVMPATIPRWGIAIGMTDHSANGARDPPLHHRLDPFYPQATAGDDLFAISHSILERSRIQAGVFSSPTGYTRLSTADLFANAQGSRRDPCALSTSPYNLRPTCDTWFLHGVLFAGQDSAVTTGQNRIFLRIGKQPGRLARCELTQDCTIITIPPLYILRLRRRSSSRRVAKRVY